MAKSEIEEIEAEKLQDAKIEAIKEEYRYSLTLILTVVGLLFSVSQICALLPVVVNNAQSIFHFQASIVNWVNLISNSIFLISCICTSSILIMFAVLVQAVGAAHITIARIFYILRNYGVFTLLWYGFAKMLNWIVGHIFPKRFRINAYSLIHRYIEPKIE